MDKCILIQDVKQFFKNGMTIMCGGFMGVGTPDELVQALLNNGVNNLTLIGNDTAFPETGVGL